MLFAVLLVAVAAEVLAFVAVAGQIHVLPALGLLLVVSALGPLVVKRVGLGVLAHARQRLAAGEAPTREVLDGLLVLAGGVLLCVPGFVGDAVGLLLMVPAVRHLTLRFAGRRVAAGAPRFVRVDRPGVVDAPTHDRPAEDHPDGDAGPSSADRTLEGGDHPQGEGPSRSA